MNAGKQFEKEVKDSMPDYCFYYRLRDGTAAWGDKENTRFQQSNMCDCLVFQTESRTLYFIELKTHKGKSLPFSAIRENQIKQLSQANMYNGITAGFIINFRECEKSYFVSADKVEMFVNTGERKSIPIAWCESYGTELPMHKKRTTYRIDMEPIFKNKGVV